MTVEPALAPPPVRAYYTHMEEGRAVLRRVLREVPTSLRKLAHAAGVSESLLRAVRDGDRRLTSDTRQAVTAALRRWERTCGELADALEAAEPRTSEREGEDNG